MRKIVAVRPGDVMDIARAYGYLLRAGWRLFAVKDRGNRWLRDRVNDAGREQAPEEDAWVDRAARWTNSAARRPFPWARCLQRSLALCMWMEAHGLKPALRLGVRKNGNGIDAHSWVEFNGRIVNDFDSVTTVFATFQQWPATPNDDIDPEDGGVTRDHNN